MINDIFTFLNNALSGNLIFAIAASFGWGVLSIALSPCHLSSIPLVIGFINSKGNVTVKRTFMISLFFSFGIMISIALIGLITAAAGMMIGSLGRTGNYIVSAVFFITGLYLLNVVKLSGQWALAGSKISGPPRRGFWQAFSLGLLFGIGLGPCTFAFMAPVLGVVFGTASTGFFYAAVLILGFAAGHCSVIVLAGTLTARVQRFLNWTEGSRAVDRIKKICGALVISAGAYFVYTA